MSKRRVPAFHPCVLKELPSGIRLRAARTAIEANPINAPSRMGLVELTRRLTVFFTGSPSPMAGPQHLALLTTKYWSAKGVNLTVGFMEPLAVELREKILHYMNRWGQYANVTFSWVGRDPQVRITREGDGYWSYLGTDILHVSAREPTMSLQAFSLSTPDSEFERVVCHETGHTLGFVHEHLRAELVAKLDVAKTIAYFERTQGWSEATVRAQVLTPISEVSLTGTVQADPDSIMCYQLPGSITIDGKPIPGGTTIDRDDQALVAKLYPKGTPVQPPGQVSITVPQAGRYVLQA